MKFVISHEDDHRFTCNMKESKNITTLKCELENKEIKLNITELFIKSREAESELPEQEEYYALMSEVAKSKSDLTVDEINEIIRDVNAKIANAPITIEVLAKKKKIHESSIFFRSSEHFVLLTITGKCFEFRDLFDLVRNNKKYNF